MSVITVRITEPASAGQIAQFYNTLLSRVETGISGGPDITISAEAVLGTDADVPDELRVFVSPGDPDLSPNQLRELQDALSYVDSRVTVLPPRSEVKAA